MVEERKIAECAYTLKRYRRRPPPRDEPKARGRISLESIHPDQRRGVCREFSATLRVSRLAARLLSALLLPASETAIDALPSE